MSILRELKQRKVFRVAAVYVLVAWGILQVVDVIGEPLNLPDWFSSITIVLLGGGFPIAIIFSWIFDIGPDGPTRTAADAGNSVGVRGGLEVALLLLLIVGIGWLIFRDITHGESEVASGSRAVPVVILMDTYADRGVYDEETRRKSGTNADVLSDMLSDLPIIIQKETIGSTWDRENQLLKQQPSLVLIHRSAFFHSMNQDLGVGYPTGSEDYSEQFRRLYEIADNKLVALLGFLSQGNRDTRFLVYSRGTGGGWPQEEYRAQWVRSIEGRFPSTEGRVTTIAVPGSTTEGSFRRPDAEALIRRTVVDLLAVDGSTSNPL
ncbi:hypothetical protein E2F43_18570 [Seongchinamella unica]|uniref:Uncharacterized protein n=1 Tax=Seongchinamella unica TaxID=2547392 RepID=A0A4V2ZX18_9GAMM|nr:hypothetical protein [Seongchinamella unica]TDG11391.1 hypothetical protein E2F43_18570 [Seongchinamella unica]